MSVHTDDWEGGQCEKSREISEEERLAQKAARLEREASAQILLDNLENSIGTEEFAGAMMAAIRGNVHHVLIGNGLITIVDQHGGQDVVSDMIAKQFNLNKFDVRNEVYNAFG